MAISRFARASVGFLFLVATGVAQQAQAQNWDGSGQIRFGAFLQGSFTDFNAKQTPQFAPEFRQSASDDAWGGGVAAGYDVRFGQIVVGVESDVSFDGTSTKPAANVADQYSSAYLATLRGRLGYLVRPDILLYGTLGVAALGVQYKSNGAGVGTSTLVGVFNKKDATLAGLSVGGGIEYDAGWGVLFGEYLYNDYGSWTFGGFNNNRLAIDATQGVARLGVKFKVGHDFEFDDYTRQARSDRMK